MFNLNGQPVSQALTGRRLALFAYLLTREEPSPRLTLGDLLWSDVGEAQAREHLRGLLSRLRQIIGDYLLVTRQTVSFNWQAPYWSDVGVFNAYLTTGQSTVDPALLSEVLLLYQGEFLAGLYVQDAPVFEAWLSGQRHQWHMQALQGWQQLVNYHLTQGEDAAGLSATRRLLALEPWHEEAHRQQMVMLARSGQRDAALAQFERCRMILREEVDAPPSAETIALYEQIKAGAWSPPLPVSLRTAPITVTASGHAPAIITGTDDPSYRIVNSATAATTPLPAVDWGSMPQEPNFYGRQTELNRLQQWSMSEQRRVVTILGAGGQGKTALVVQFIHTLTQSIPSGGEHRENGQPAALPAFERIICRSLVTAPPLTDILQDWLQQLSNQQVVTLPRTVDQQFTLLYEYLQQRRFLLVLDNGESILLDDGSGACRPGYETYEQLWQLFVQRDHQCCLLLTSRERPRTLNNQAEQTGTLCTLLLDGLSLTDGQQLLRRHGVVGQETTIAALLRFYSGNPLALKLVADTIDELFAGDVDAFLQEETPFFADISAMLDQQFARLSSLEQELLTWLALEQEPIVSQTLWSNLVLPPAKRDYLAALRALVRRSLVQTQGEWFGLQNVILEYTRNRLVNTIGEELTIDRMTSMQVAGDSGAGAHLPLATCPPILLSSFNRHALLKAQTKEYVRAGQRRLVVEPLLQRLRQVWGAHGVVELFQWLLVMLRDTRRLYTPLASGYAATNILHLLLQMNIDLTGYDFSNLTLRQACLRDATLRGVSFAASNLQECLFTDVFAAVTALAFHPSGAWLAIGTFDGTARLVRLSDNQVHRILQGHTNAIFGLAISPDGKLLASSSSDQQVRVWDLQTYTLRYDFMETVNFVRTVIFSPDSRWLAVAGGDGTVKLYEAASGQLQHTLHTIHAWVCAVAFSPDGQWLAAGGRDGGLSLWQTSALTTPVVASATYTLRGHEAAIETLLFSHDSQLLFSGSRDHLIHFWQVAAAPRDQPQCTLRGHHHTVRRIALSPNGRYLASGGADAMVYIWDVRDGSLLDTLVGHEQWVWAVAFEPHPVGDVYRLASAGNDQRVLLWEVSIQEGVSRGRLHQTMSGYSDAVRSLAFLPDSHLLISGGFDKSVHVWDVQRGFSQFTLKGHQDWIFSVAVSPDRSRIASAGYERIVYLWPLPTPTTSDANSLDTSVPHQEPIHPSAPLKLQGHTSIISGLAFSPDGTTLASCGQDGMICLWDVRRGQLLQTLSWQGVLVWSVAFSPDGKLLASANFDKTVRLWDVQDLAASDGLPSTRLRHTFTGHGGLVWMVAFSPNGQTLISTSNDQTVRLWELAGKQHRVLTGHTNAVRGLAVSPSRMNGGFTFASSDDDKSIHIWDGQSGELLHRLQGHRGGIHTLAYSPDGAILASASERGGIRLWDGQSGAPLQTLRALRPYSGLDITGVTGITPAQKAALLALGAVEQ